MLVVIRLMYVRLMLKRLALLPRHILVSMQGAPGLLVHLLIGRNILIFPRDQQAHKPNPQQSQRHGRLMHGLHASNASQR